MHPLNGRQINQVLSNIAPVLSKAIVASLLVIVVTHTQPAYTQERAQGSSTESAGGAVAQANIAASQSAAIRLFDISGMRELISQIPAGTANAFESSLVSNGLPAQFDSVGVNSVRHAVRSAFTSETFDHYLIKEFEDEMSEHSKQLMLEWYTSPLGKRVRQAEVNNSLLKEHDRFLAYQQQLIVTGVETQREQIIYRMDETIRSTEAAVDMMANIQIAFNISLSRFLPEDQQLSGTEIQRLADQNRSQLLSQYRNQTRETLLYTYQEFSNEELLRFNELLSTTAGQEFVTAINNGIKKGMFASSLDLGDELGKLLAKQDGSPGI